MNQTQAKQVKDALDRLSNIDLSTKLTEAYPDVADTDQTVIGELSINEFVGAIERISVAFEHADINGQLKFMPFTCNFQNDFGNGNLNQDFANLVNQINGNNYPAAVSSINRLLHYLTLNGLYVRSSDFYSPIDLETEQNQITTLKNYLSGVSENLSELLNEFEETKAKLDNLTKSKSAELNEITSLLEAARQQESEINSINNKGLQIITRAEDGVNSNEQTKLDLDRRIREAQNFLKEREEKLDEFIAEQDKLFEEAFSNTEHQRAEFAKHDSEMMLALADIEQRHNSYNERSQYLDDLIGREVGASLFETFKARKKELTGTIKFWGFLVPVAAGLTIWWIGSIFNGTSLAELTWQSFAVNSLKIIPALAFMWFVISQYSKERNFQEEYAFKSAVALTVNSYAEQLNTDENKDKLIMESVDKIYRTPIDKKLEHALSANTVKEHTSLLKQIVSDVKSMNPLSK
ncbi:hypothetical protein [Agarivorans aestuarii]|uniref:hypothetical protein n=1 Tax=Agarivorans aestuarii TaxID=1563703 RepID=UPI001C7EB54E|nr:hypothetical protein [Agarivorans aestuarii]